VVGACEFSDCVEIVEEHNRDELDLMIEPALQELDAFEALYVPRLDADDDLFLQQLFIDIRVLVAGPPMPNTTNHG
jgi:hypothetical protein